MIDIGANLTNRAFEGDLPTVLERAKDAGLTGVVVTGTDVDSSQTAAALAARHAPYLASTAGVHPHDAKDVAGDWLDRLEALLELPEVKAVGETGLDFNRNYSLREAQVTVFEAQIALAMRRHQPLFVHDRESGGATLRCLRRQAPDPQRVVIHCFTGTAAELSDYLSAGYLIGITGWVCDERRGLELKDLVPRIPDAQLMIETDAPYLQPRTIEPKPSTRRNEPANLIWVARTVAAARGQSVQEVAEITRANALRFFDW